MRRAALITGATGGLGRAFAWELAARGWDLALTDVSDDALLLLGEGIRRAHGVRILTRVADLADDASLDDLASWIASGEVRLGALVNVAGFDVEGAFESRDREGLLALMRVVMEAGVILTHAALEQGTAADTLRVINTASLAGFFPMPYKATYAASKGFVLSASLALCEELRGRATITVLCPAGMPTTSSAVEAIAAQGIMGRLTTRNPSDVARLTVDAALRGRAIVVPGAINRALVAAGAIVPRAAMARLIGRRWAAARGYGPDTPAAGDGRAPGPGVSAPTTRPAGGGAATRRGA